MDRWFAIELLEFIQKSDSEFLDKKTAEGGGGTFCCGCRENTGVGIYPFWHRYGRKLCSACGEAYIRFLNTIRAMD